MWHKFDFDQEHFALTNDLRKAFREQKESALSRATNLFWTGYKDLTRSQVFMLFNDDKTSGEELCAELIKSYGGVLSPPPPSRIGLRIGNGGADGSALEEALILAGL